MSDEANNDNKQIIIIKRIKKMHAKHHGGSWKIAYADFVTAMMTFFLLMWLLSLLNKYQLQGIAEYFKKPLKEVFTKQDNISKTDTIKPDKLGPSTYKETGSKEKTKNIVDKNLGLADQQQKLKEATYGLPQNQVQTPNITPAQITTHLKDKDSDPQTEQQQLAQMKAMQADLQAKLMSDPEVSQFKNQLNFVVTSDGLKIIIKDLENKPMFSEGKTDFEQYGAKLLSWLSKEINVYKNKIIIIGHTDSVAYTGENNYTNWELSADRANATRRVLINAGMDRSKVLRIIGGADTDLLDTKQGDDPSNRRIEIIVLTDQATKHIQNQ
jgi:chemotaxis protein MotB